ncbi:unnamed protein product [Schistosoma turkestanicum]|nr:unnamed protein product [Schistosoma turkestanicum]
MNKFLTWHILSIATLIIYCLLIPLTNAWKTDTFEMPNDNGELKGGFEKVPTEYEETEPTLKQRRKWISQLPYGDLPWIYGLNQAGGKQKPYKSHRRERRFFCNPMGCV